MVSKGQCQGVASLLGGEACVESREHGDVQDTEEPAEVCESEGAVKDDHWIAGVARALDPKLFGETITYAGTVWGSLVNRH